MKEEKREQAKGLTKIALSVALMSICAWIALPFPLPFTMQTFALFLTLCLLGGRAGSLAVFAYLLLGLVGVPVFSGFRGGIGVLFSESGGYLIGFLFASLLFWGLEGICGKGGGKLFVICLGQLVCYFTATLWFAWVYLQGSGEGGLIAAATTCVLPYLLPDGVKIILALFVANRLKK